MFRLLIAGLVLLAGCSAPTQSMLEPGAETKPYLTNYSVPVLKNGCEWSKVTLSVFNQRAQTVSFNYQRCPDVKETFKVHNNGIEIKSIVRVRLPGELSFKSVLSPVFEVFKLGPDTEHGIMYSQLVRHESVGNTSVCEPVELSPHHWTYNSRALADLEFPKSDVCHNYKFAHFIFDRGIVFILYPRLGNIDFSSITYTNRG